jgi:peptidoglycan/xylan/chitin deacetylase (PgdA/CDA1 family)
MEIASHGVTHRLLTQLPSNEMQQELAESKRVLEAQLGVPVRAVAAPGGFWSRAAQEAARRAGYDAAWVSQIGINGQQARALWLKRLPVHQPLALDPLLGMIEGRRRFLWIASARQSGISVLKGVLGIRYYERLKQAWVKGKA